MIIKKSGKTIFGAELNANERKAVEMEIRRELAEYTRKHKKELESIILWQLHVQLGFGHERLKKFYREFDQALDSLIKRYELSEDDDIWLATTQLKEYGIDVDELETQSKDFA